MTAREIESKNREFINHFSDEIADCRKAANKEAVEKLERIKSRLKIERDHGNKKVLYPIEYVEIDDFEGRSWIVKLLLLNHYIAEADTAIKYIRAIKPELAPPPPKDDPSPTPDEIEPPQPPKEGKGESVIIPPGTYYFQYNVMKELGLIDKIRSRFHDNNGRGVSNSEIGQILFDIFQHKSPEEWSKAHSQHGTESSNDPIKSEIQQRRLRDFLRQNNLKE